MKKKDVFDRPFRQLRKGEEVRVGDFTIDEGDWTVTCYTKREVINREFPEIDFKVGLATYRFVETKPDVNISKVIAKLVEEGRNFKAKVKDVLQRNDYLEHEEKIASAFWSHLIKTVHQDKFKELSQIWTDIHNRLIEENEKKSAKK